ncbi:MAG: GNAT family N-acetyltransferase [Bacteroidota bacterium]
MTGITHKISFNIFRFYTRSAELCGYESGKKAGCAYAWNRKGSWPSFVLGDPGDAGIREVVQAIRSGTLPPFWITENKGGELVRNLDDAGVRVIREWSGMALGATDFKPGLPNPKVKIRTNDPGTNRDWLHIVNTELLTGSRIGDDFLDALALSGEFRWMVAYLDDEPVGTGLSFSSGDTCGLYMIATKGRARGAGVGTMVSSQLVADALESGHSNIVLHATPLGERIYRKLGFREENSYAVMWYPGQ